jgi:hypothetical protein
MEAFNGYLTSNESLVSIVTLKSITQIPRIISIKGEYNKENVLLSADLTFSINDPWVDENKITTINVRGFTKNLYQTTTNNQGQPIVGTGQHTITIPQKASDGSTILNQSEEYNEITIQFVFSLTGEGTASQPTSISL